MRKKRSSDRERALPLAALVVGDRLQDALVMPALVGDREELVEP
jgi:hypothetical protein